MIFVYIAAGILILLFAAELYLVAPRSKRKRPQFSDKKLYAHRGFYDNKTVPENSLLAFELAINNGYGIELDIHISADGVPFIFHDDSLLRMCGKDAKCESLTIEELRGLRLLKTDCKIPTLEETLRLINGKTPIIAELKDEKPKQSVCEKSDELLSVYSGEYCVESFNPFCIAWYRKNRPEILRGVLSSSFLRDKTQKKSLTMLILSQLWLNAVARPDFIAFDIRYKNALGFRICKLFFKPLCAAWTVRDKDTLDKTKKLFDIFIFENFRPK